MGFVGGGPVRALVVYYSETGNTEKVARAIARGLGAEAVNVKDVKDVSEYDLLCVGTPVHYFGPAKPVLQFLDSLPSTPGKMGAAFCTFHNTGNEKTIQVVRRKLEEKGLTFLGGFSCKGQSRIVANIGPRVFNKGRPNEEDLRKAEDFGRSLSSHIKKS